MRAYTGHQLSYLWSVRVIPVRTIIFSATGFRMSKTNGSCSVSEIQYDFLALQYKQINQKKSGDKNTELLGWAISIPALRWKVPGKTENTS